MYITAPMVEVWFNQLEAIEWLLHKGADTNKQLKPQAPLTPYGPPTPARGPEHPIDKSRMVMCGD